MSCTHLKQLYNFQTHLKVSLKNLAVPHFFNPFIGVKKLDETFNGLAHVWY